jgi:hypothetical protein
VSEDTAAARAAMLPGMPAELAARVQAGEPVWTTAELLEMFEVTGFAAPFVVVRRRSDGAVGSLMFTHSPRYYFGWEPS